ncbi:hypothetical protein BU23DRAFT_547030 [Bimuria novae-zelandiae CBS 107.79]|uniref:Transmembrane protein n=1 Tax=Bimuria novae-zelandiae CBS 107.79 TaxID=1447943 RepID=A0A6A5UIR9_9PLEO|nr:hypothetical protein BU23DRAFT_547030 [Bimuria novae-zelandiae CBS 107.79]
MWPVPGRCWPCGGYDLSTAPSAPTRRRTRALLRVIRSSLIFAFWSIVRYAKYVAIGSLVATIGAGAFGTVVSGAGFVLAPTGIAGTIVAASIWGLGKFALKRVKRRWEPGHGYGGLEDARQERMSGAMRMERGPDAVPW